MAPSPAPWTATWTWPVSKSDGSAEIGIDLDRATDELLEQGVASFSGDYEKLIANLAEKTSELAAG